MPLEDRPHPLERPEVADDEQVIGRARVRIGAKVADARKQVIERGRRIARHERRRAAEAFDQHAHGERGAEGIGIGILVGDHEGGSRASQPVDDLLRDRCRIACELDRHRRVRRRRLRGRSIASAGTWASGASPS